MSNIVSNVSTDIIISHMTSKKFDATQILNMKEYQVSFYDENRKKLFGNLDDEIYFSKDIQMLGNQMVLTDTATVGHLGIYFVGIKENVFFEKMQTVKINIVLFFLLVYGVIAIVGFYLAKLFLKPIKDEREKINNFIKDTTHELNTPITAIMMSSENENISNKQLERIRLSANRISEIYKDLTYIFLQNKEMVCHKESLCLRELIEEQLQYFEPIIAKKRIELFTSLDAFEYTMNRDDFIRLFNNLISNAIKYNSIGGKIEIQLQKNVLKICDTGMGIDADKINDIFKRYVRATKEQGGFGIGLSIVKHVCDDYKIFIEVDSKTKEGSCFTLTF